MPDVILTFESLGIVPWLCQLCRQVGLIKPTPVQSECIPRLLKKDERRVAACAPTGTGKTAAYVLPIMQQLSADMFGVYCVVLSPTRELATQIADQFHLFGSGLGVRVAVLVGGVKQAPQLKSIETRSHVVVGTPGRVHYILTNTVVEITTRYVKYIVLDEADKLLGEPEHANDVHDVTKFLMRNRDPMDVRICLFSATLDPVEAWALLGVDGEKKALAQGVVRCEKEGTLTEQFMLVPSHVKLVHLAALLDPRFCPWSCVMVFCNSRRRCEIVRLTLQLLGYSVTGMHSLQNQQQRSDALTLFKIGAAKIMVCTDVFARGIDVAGVEMVVHFDFPASNVRYMHRAGRTARGGNSGTSLVFVTERDVKLFRKLEKRLERTISKRRPEKEQVILKMVDTVTQAVLEAQGIVHRLFPKPEGAGPNEEEDEGLGVALPSSTGEGVDHEGESLVVAVEEHDAPLRKRVKKSKKVMA